MSEPSRFDGPLRILGNGCHVIQSLEDWKNFAPPTGGPARFRDCKSAKEVARAWVGSPSKPGVPGDLTALLQTSQATKDFEPGLVVPEARLRLNDQDGARNYRGNVRNADIAVFGSSNGVATFVAIEAKAGETFGNTIEKTIENPKKDSNLPKRVERLSRLLLGHGSSHPDVASVRYQLLHGLAGTLFEAKAQGAGQAVFVVHEFKTKSGMKKTKPGRNEKDLAAFLKRFGAEPPKQGELLKLQMPRRRGLPAIPVFIGRIVTGLPREC